MSATRSNEFTARQGILYMALAGRLHHKSFSEKDFFEVALVPASNKAFTLDLASELKCNEVENWYR